MGHLVAYEEAKGERAKALAAIVVAGHKNAKYLAWAWAERAIDHAIAAGIANASELVESGRYPDCSQLRKALLAL